MEVEKVPSRPAQDSEPMQCDYRGNLLAEEDELVVQDECDDESGHGYFSHQKLFHNVQEVYSSEKKGHKRMLKLSHIRLQ